MQQNNNLINSDPQTKLNYLKNLDFQIKEKLNKGVSYLLSQPDGPKVPSWMEEKFNFTYI